MRACALSLYPIGHNKPDLLRHVSFMDPTKIMKPPPYLPHWGDISRIINSCGETWLAVTWSLSTSMTDMMHITPQIFGDPLKFSHVFDAMWTKADSTMWEAGKRLDHPGESGRVAKVFGLINPYDVNRPTFTKYIFRSLEPSRGRVEAASTPAPAPSPYVEAIPIAGTSESAAKSGHAYVSETNKNKPQNKKKTKRTAAPNTTSVEEPGHINEDEQEGEDSFPVTLPTHFKLGKRLLKVCAPTFQEPATLMRCLGFLSGPSRR